MMGREVVVPHLPQRIISLVPSQTELLYDLGLSKEVIGQTIFCLHPEDMHQIKPRIGGTKKLKLELIRSLQPDLIIGNKEENEQTQIETLMEEFPVWMSDIKDLNGAVEMIELIGHLVGKSTKADEISQQILSEFKGLGRPEAQKCLYFIWREPWMAAGKDTFIDDMLSRIGLKNVAWEVDGRYPVISEQWLALVQPEVILLSSEPYPFKEKHLEELRDLVPNAKILLVDGELFSWYGSRLLHSVAYFKTLIKQIHG